MSPHLEGIGGGFLDQSSQVCTAEAFALASNLLNAHIIKGLASH